MCRHRPFLTELPLSRKGRSQGGQVPATTRKESSFACPKRTRANQDCNPAERQAWQDTLVDQAMIKILVRLHGIEATQQPGSTVLGVTPHHSDDRYRLTSNHCLPGLLVCHLGKREVQRRVTCTVAGKSKGQTATHLNTVAMDFLLSNRPRYDSSGAASLPSLGSKCRRMPLYTYSLERTSNLC